MVLKVSVIIPALNEESVIAASIASAVSAGAEEIIVVDGGSSDGTVEIAAAEVRVVASDCTGRASQQNQGAKLVTGDVLLFLHADCCLNPSAIAEVRQQLGQFPDIIAGCFKQNIHPTGLTFRLLAAGNLWRARLFKWAYGDQGIFVRADVFHAIGGFPKLDFMEDLFLMKKLKKQGRITVLNSPLLVSARRWQRRGVLGQTLRNWLLVAFAHAGASPNWLARFYPNDR